MSGGSYNYEYCKVEEEYCGCMYDAELDELMRDLVPVLKAVEWWKSGDTGEESYRKTVTSFKKKWLREGESLPRLKKIVDRKFEECKRECLKMMGLSDKNMEGKDDCY